MPPVRPQKDKKNFAPTYLHITTEKLFVAYLYITGFITGKSPQLIFFFFFLFAPTFYEHGVCHKIRRRASSLLAKQLFSEVVITVHLTEISSVHSAFGQHFDPEDLSRQVEIFLIMVWGETAVVFQPQGWHCLPTCFRRGASV